VPFVVAVSRARSASNLPRAWEAAMLHSILIVDDSPFIRRSVRRYIEANTAFDVCGEAENGKIAVEKVSELNPDIVILDLQMPVMDGMEAARQITRMSPKTAILMFTLHESEQLLNNARAVGVKDVLSKSDSVADRLLASLECVDTAA
jgi:DNA-binding NarL/FixJ family response regulator